VSVYYGTNCLICHLFLRHLQTARTPTTTAPAKALNNIKTHKTTGIIPFGRDGVRSSVGIAKTSSPEIANISKANQTLRISIA
jgi:hypothetical protein